jgi:hypothetical protein
LTGKKEFFFFPSVPPKKNNIYLSWIFFPFSFFFNQKKMPPRKRPITKKKVTIRSSRKTVAEKIANAMMFHAPHHASLPSMPSLFGEDDEVEGETTTEKNSERNCVCCPMFISDKRVPTEYSTEKSVLKKLDLGYISIFCKHLNDDNPNNTTADIKTTKWKYSIWPETMKCAVEIDSGFLVHYYTKAIINRIHEIEATRRPKEKQDLVSRLCNYLGEEYTFGDGLGYFKPFAFKMNQCVKNHFLFPSLPIGHEMTVFRKVFNVIELEWRNYKRSDAVHALREYLLPPPKK